MRGFVGGFGFLGEDLRILLFCCEAFYRLELEEFGEEFGELEKSGKLGKMGKLGKLGTICRFVSLAGSSLSVTSFVLCPLQLRLPEAK